MGGGVEGYGGWGGVGRGCGGGGVGKFPRDFWDISGKFPRNFRELSGMDETCKTILHNDKTKF